MHPRIIRARALGTFRFEDDKERMGLARKLASRSPKLISVIAQNGGYAVRVSNDSVQIPAGAMRSKLASQNNEKGLGLALYAASFTIKGLESDEILLKKERCRYRAYIFPKS